MRPSRGYPSGSKKTARSSRAHPSGILPSSPSRMTEYIDSELRECLLIPAELKQALKEDCSLDLQLGTCKLYPMEVRRMLACLSGLPSIRSRA